MGTNKKISPHIGHIKIGTNIGKAAATHNAGGISHW